MPKGPPPRLDLSKRALEELKESDVEEAAGKQTKQIQTLFLDQNKLAKLTPAFFSIINATRFESLRYIRIYFYVETILEAARSLFF